MDITALITSWSSDATLVATVSSAGLVSGVDAGSALITASLEGISAATTVIINVNAIFTSNQTASLVTIEVNATQGYELLSASNADCNTSYIYNCTNAEVMSFDANATQINSYINGTTPGSMWLKKGNLISKRVQSDTLNLSAHYGHQALSFLLSNSQSLQ